MSCDNCLEIMREHLPLLDNFKDRNLATKVAKVWYDLWQESKWENLSEAAWNLQCPGISLIEHTRSVSEASIEFAKVRERVYGEQIDFDILLAGALLHDASILLELEPDGDGAKKSFEGKIFQHSFLGAHKALIDDLPKQVVHIIISHTWQSRLFPQTPEAIIICCCDFADADIHRLRFGGTRLMDRYKYGFTTVG